MTNPKSFQIIGTGAVVSFFAGSGGAVAGSRWLQISAPSTNSSDALIGGSEVSSTVGYPIPAGTGQFFPGTTPETFAFYDLTEMNIYLANGDVLNGLYGG